MKLWQHMLVQFVLLILQGEDAITSMIPPKWKPLVTLVLGAAQMTLAAYGQFFNPDGTKATTAYVVPQPTTPPAPAPPKP